MKLCKLSILFWAGVRNTETQTLTERGTSRQNRQIQRKERPQWQETFQFDMGGCREQRETEKQNRKKVTESERVVSVFSTRTRSGQSCSARLAGAEDFTTAGLEKAK